MRAAAFAFVRVPARARRGVVRALSSLLDLLLEVRHVNSQLLDFRRRAARLPVD